MNSPEMLDFDDIDIHLLDELHEKQKDARPIKTRSRGRGIKPAEEYGTMFRYIPAIYDVDGKKCIAVERKTHFVPSLKRSFDCLGDGSTCVICHQSLRKIIRDVGTSLRYMITVFSPDSWHLVPGMIDNREKGGGVIKFKSKLQCSGDGCEYCEEGLEIEEGRISFWDMPQTHWDDLFGFITRLYNTCTGCGGTVFTQFLGCGQGDCQYLVDPVKVGMSDKDIRNNIMRDSVCGHCGSSRKMIESRACRNLNRKVNTECTTHERTKPIDRDMLIRTVKRPNENRTTIELVQFGDTYDIAKHFPTFAGKIKPLDLGAMRVTQTADEQAAQLGLDKNPLANIQEV